MSNTVNTTKIRKCSALLDAPAPHVVCKLCDEIDKLKALLKEACEPVNDAMTSRRSDYDGLLARMTDALKEPV